MALREYSTLVRSEADRMVVVGGRGLDLAIGSCPGWTLEDLVCHTGWLFRWYGYLLGLAEGEAQTEEGLAAAGVPPEAGLALQRPTGDLVTWFRQGCDDMLQAFEVLAPTTTLDTYYGPNTPPWLLLRRMAHELAIHRWDAEQAQGTATWFDPVLAVDGVEELLDYWVSGPVAFPQRHGGGPSWSDFGGTGQRVCLQATDSDEGWVVTLDGATAGWLRGRDEGADVTARAKLSEFYLLVWKRQNIERLETQGDTGLLERWHAACLLGGRR
jgi:uncharacterized protein (TIGR03083 family)